jgi:hypothetical protein
MSKYPNISAGDVAVRMIEIAAENPRFAYDPPGEFLYIEFGQDNKKVGSCLVGRALVDLGVDPDDIVEGWSASATLGRLGIRVTFADNPNTMRWITCAQAHQDRRTTWHTAIQQANSFFPNVAEKLAEKMALKAAAAK